MAWRPAAGSARNTTAWRPASPCAPATAALAQELAELAILEPDTPRTSSATRRSSSSRATARRSRKRGRSWRSRPRAARCVIRATLQLRDPLGARGGTCRDWPRSSRRPSPPRITRSFVSWTPPRGLLDLVRYKAMEEQPDPEPEDAALLADWMRRQGMVPEAAFWLTTLSPATCATARSRLCARPAYVQLRDWRGLETTLRQGVLGAAPPTTPLDLAFAAHLQREAGHADHARLDLGRRLGCGAGNSGGDRSTVPPAPSRGGSGPGPDGTDDACSGASLRVNPMNPGGWQSLAAIAMAQGASEKAAPGLREAWLKAEPRQPSRPRAAWSGEDAVVIHHAWPMDTANGGPCSRPPRPGRRPARSPCTRRAGRDDEALDRLDQAGSRGAAGPAGRPRARHRAGGARVAAPD